MVNKNKTLKLETLNIGNNFECFVIAEIGINHNGKLNLAKQLIDQAANSGANAVKFQKRTINQVYSKEYLKELRKTPFGSTQRDLKEGLEFNKKQYVELKKYSEKKGLVFIVSPWDEKSVDFMCDIGVSCIKIASPCLHDINLLKHIASKKLPVIMSVGMTDYEQIFQSLEVLADLEIVLVHCVSSYPTKDTDINMNRLKTLMHKFPNVSAHGYSGHELGDLPPIMAVSLGAKLMEKHFTLDKEMWGSDQKFSLEPHEFKEMVRKIRNVETMLGNNKIEVLNSEIPSMIKLQRKRKIDAVIFDTDGVLTNGRLYVDISNGKKANNKKVINYKNLDAFSQFKRKGYTTIIISKESEKVNGKIVELFKPDIKMFECTDKWDSVQQILTERKIEIDRAAYVGDSFSDLDVFRNLEYTFAPSDAILDVQKISKWVIPQKSEDGFLAEVLTIIENINRGI